MKTKILLFCIALFVIKPFKSTAQVNIQDSLALVDYYDSTYGVSPWQFGQSWDLQNPVNTWSGIGLSNNRVVSIRLWGGGWNGSIPSSFGNLTALQSIDFLDFVLTSLPESFGDLISLTTVSFHAVFRNVPFPASITKAPNLKIIDMEDNYFSDSIPSAIGNMANLTFLDLSQNYLSGPIPVSINRMDSLKEINIYLNRYTFKEIAPFISDYIAAGKTYLVYYSPQLNIPIHRFNNKIAVSAGGDLSDDTFKWYKDSALVATIIGDSTYEPTETGRYYVAVTNSIATDLTLYSDEFTLNYVMPDSAAKTTINITGILPVNMTDGIFEIATMQPTTGANQLNGDVTALVIVDSAVRTFNDQPYVERHYDITPAENASNAEAIVTLYFTEQDFSNYNNYVTGNNLNLPLLPTGGVDNGNVRITQFHGNFAGSSHPENYNNSNINLIIPTSVSWDNINQWWTVTFPVRGFSGFFISTGNMVLPLTLLNFYGAVQHQSINLKWLTSNEILTKEFIVERSANLNSFKTIGIVTAQSTQHNNHYNYNDAAPLNGINFYRLKMIDQDGKFSYSNILKINFEKIITFLEIYPNPASSILNIKITSTKNENVIMKVVDASGKLIVKKEIPINNGITSTSLNIEKLFSGLYYLSTTLNGIEQKINFIKK